MITWLRWWRCRLLHGGFNIVAQAATLHNGQAFWRREERCRKAKCHRYYSRREEI